MYRQLNDSPRPWVRRTRVRVHGAEIRTPLLLSLIIHLNQLARRSTPFLAPAPATSASSLLLGQHGGKGGSVGHIILLISQLAVHPRTWILTATGS